MKMSLQNLLKIGQLEAHETNAEQVRRMLDSAERSITDAGQEWGQTQGVSPLQGGLSPLFAECG